MTEKQIQTALESKRDLFLTGPAGTGKSYLLRDYILSHNNILVCAPTAIAALNLGGDTMHRLFHIPVPCYEPPSFAKDNKKAVPKATLRTLAAADAIVIDEISMCRSDVFRYAAKVLRKAEKLKGDRIRLIVSGDFSQLPPVIKKGEDKFLKKFGFHPSGCPFTTAEWASFNFRTVELTEIKRQTDKEFVENLNAIRVGQFKNVSYFDQFVTEGEGFEDAIYICGTNAEADRMNQAYLESLPGDMTAFTAKKEGTCPAGIADDILLLKVGARVIFTANDNVKGQYRNSEFGTITATGSEGVVVSIDGRERVVRPHEWPIHSYSVSGGKLVQKQIGSIRQLPLKVARAITIHRSQGQTFDKVVISPDVFAPGQLYVALSRVRSPEGMRLTRPLSQSDLILDETVRKFYKNGYQWDRAKTERKTAAKSGTKTAGKKTTTKNKTDAAKKSKRKPA